MPAETRSTRDKPEPFSITSSSPPSFFSASQDFTADPRGEFLSVVNAAPVFQLFGKKGLGTTEMPALDRLVLSCLAKDPADRPQSAKELSLRLAEVEGARAWTQDRARDWWVTHQPAGEAR